MNIDDKNVISFEKYVESLGETYIYNSIGGEHWHTYWEKHMEPLYEIEYWKLINKVNIKDLVDDILERFDFENVENYMKAVNWTWQNRKTTPSIKNLKSCVLSLIGGMFEDDEFKYNPSTSSTGGFSVSIFLVNNKPYKIVVEFQMKDGNKFEEETKISTLRKKKLETIEKLIK